MTTPRPDRPHLRLVGSAPREGDERADDGADFDPVDRAPHDLHRAYHELEDDAVVDAAFAAPAGAGDAEAEPGDAPARLPQPRFVVVALIAFQLLAALGYVSKYVTLARGEDVYGVAALLSVPAALALYVGAVLLALRPGRGRGLFIVAAVGFGLSVPAWGIQYGWTWPMAFGSMLGLAGAWFARPETRPDDADAAQP